jgi:hypothetical protein
VGIDELLIYHYLVAEAFRYSDEPYETFFARPKAQQASRFGTRFSSNTHQSPRPAAASITTLQRLGHRCEKADLHALRKHYARWSAGDFITQAMSVANVRKVCMTNSPFDDQERQPGSVASRATSALRPPCASIRWCSIGKTARRNCAPGATK